MRRYDYGNCHVCGGTIQEGLTEQTVRAGDEWILVRSVPTGVCLKCGEQIFRWDVTSRLEEIVSQRANHEPAQHIRVPVFAF